MKWLWAACFFACASMAHATVDDWPALYDVTGVAEGDVLNVRSGPSASADIIGMLDRAAVNVEVVAVNNAETWGRVNAGERSGWVSLQFMARQPAQYAGDFPDVTACFGTEPFWDLTINDDEVLLTQLGVDAVSVSPFDRIIAAGRIDRFSIVSTNITGVIGTQICNDGMSDMLFGLSADILVPSPDHSGRILHVTGCCTIKP